VEVLVYFSNLRLAIWLTIAPFLESQIAKDKRTRFHVITALSLCADYKKTKGAQEKKAWMEEQRKIWLAKEEVCASG
jgi:hypothetical protein